MPNPATNNGNNQTRLDAQSPESFMRETLTLLAPRVQSDRQAFRFGLRHSAPQWQARRRGAPRGASAYVTINGPLRRRH
jgi:hypothetical protein